MSTFMHPTKRESMLLTVQQEDPDSSDNDSVKPGNVSEDELDMILATMGTTSLKDSELAILQNDASAEDQVEEESDAEEPDVPLADEVLATPETPSSKDVATPVDTPAPTEASVPPTDAAAPSDDPQPAPRLTARRVMKNFFNKLRNVK